MSVDMSPEAVSVRLRAAADLADLRADRRLFAKLDMRPSAISQRLRQVAQLRSLCLRLGRVSGSVDAG